MVFSADESLMALTGEVKGRLHIGIYTLRDFRRHAVLVGERPVFSADGRWLVVSEQWVHAVQRTAGGLTLPRVRSLLRKRGKTCRSSPFHREISLGTTGTLQKRNRALVAVRLATGRELYRLPEPYCPLALSADGRTMLFISAPEPRPIPTRLRVYDATTGKRLWHMRAGREGAIYAASVARNRAHVLYRSGELWRLTSRELVKLGDLGRRRHYRRGICFGHSPCGSTTVYPAFFLADGRYLYARDSGSGPGRVYLLRRKK